MTKNIILCADGTGNRGGDTPDTNVYRMFKAIDRDSPVRGRKQFTFYDKGVGTDTNKYIRAVSGALGFGFAKNVCALYEHLARTYDPGDIVYLFGFSRGAATVRAFGGMLQECGLVDRKHPACQTDGCFDYDKFKVLSVEAFEHYRNRKGDQFRSLDHVLGEVRIKFMGVWDTVSALGFPYQRTGDPLLEDVLERPLPVWLLRGFDRIFEFGRLAHNFYNYTPSGIVDHVYHAVSIDDERKSFLPRIWDEKSSGGRAEVTQVWFSGVHSDVGGGYNQSGLSYEAMVWMMERAEHHGLDFYDGALQDAKSKANAHGLLHDSRDGLALYYRYAPRNIEILCADSEDSGSSKLDGPIRIHQSVMDRMIRTTDYYAPGLLPSRFDVVSTYFPDKNSSKTVSYGIDIESPVDPHIYDDSPTAVESASGNSGWRQERTRIESLVRWRRRLYRIFADCSLFVFIAALYLYTRSDEVVGNIKISGLDPLYSLSGIEWSSKFDGTFFKYISPKILENFIDVVWVQNPLLLLLIVMTFLGILRIRSAFHKRTIKTSNLMRNKVVAAWQNQEELKSRSD